jgi:hypothetical protein
MDMAEDPNTQPEGTYAVKLAWVGLEDTPVEVVNHFASQFDESLFYVSFGLATPPLLVGTPEERRKQAELIDVVPIETLARVALTPKAMGQLIDVLQRNLTASEERHHRPTDGDEE